MYNRFISNTLKKDFYIQADTTGAVRLLRNEDTVVFVQADINYVEVNEEHFHVERKELENGATFVAFWRKKKLIGTIELRKEEE